mmetsp:Transcript_19992/g.50597  ORF Transcript_19992/g.50597 Transcript_19992/m.50597 type:complete len:212 (+) Transcript_19992:283-918(+)
MSPRDAASSGFGGVGSAVQERGWVPVCGGVRGPPHRRAVGSAAAGARRLGYRRLVLWPRRRPDTDRLRQFARQSVPMLPACRTRGRPSAAQRGTLDHHSRADDPSSGGPRVFGRIVLPAGPVVDPASRPRALRPLGQVRQESNLFFQQRGDPVVKGANLAIVRPEGRDGLQPVFHLFAVFGGSTVAGAVVQDLQNDCKLLLLALGEAAPRI